MINQNPKFDPKIHPRRSIRLKGYDYCVGAYFVTIVAYQRECLFGEIVDGEMVLNGFGKIADECWRAIPEHFSFVELGAHMVMPNHVHGVIMIADDSRGTIYRAPTVEHYGKPTMGSLPTIIRTYKAAVTRRIGREYNASGIWQRNYYEHIIRDDHEMNNIFWRYIESNPGMWEGDVENPRREDK